MRFRHLFALAAAGFGPGLLAVEPASAPSTPQLWIEQVEQSSGKGDLRDLVRALPHPDVWPDWFAVVRRERERRTENQPPSATMLRAYAPELLLRTLLTPESEMEKALQPLFEKIESMAPAPGRSRGCLCHTLRSTLKLSMSQLLPGDWGGPMAGRMARAGDAGGLWTDDQVQ